MIMSACATSRHRHRNRNQAGKNRTCSDKKQKADRKAKVRCDTERIRLAGHRMRRWWDKASCEMAMTGSESPG